MQCYRYPVSFLPAERNHRGLWPVFQAQSMQSEKADFGSRSFLQVIKTWQSVLRYQMYQKISFPLHLRACKCRILRVGGQRQFRALEVHKWGLPHPNRATELLMTMATCRSGFMTWCSLQRVGCRIFSRSEASLKEGWCSIFSGAGVSPNRHDAEPPYFSCLDANITTARSKHCNSPVFTHRAGLTRIECCRHFGARISPLLQAPSQRR